MAEREGCQSRSLSLLLKPCIPSDPHRHFSTPSPLLRPVPAPTTFSSLPDDLLVEVLSRASLPSLSLVCRRFRQVLDSEYFLSLRRRNGLLNDSLLVVSVSSDLTSIYRAKLSFSPSNSGIPQNVEISNFPFSSPSGSFSSETFSHAQSAAIGRWVYLIGRGSTLRLDSWTGSVAIRAATLFPRKKFAVAAINGKIYIAGGSSRSSAVEEYDPESDTWRVVANAPCKRYACVGATANGIFYIAGGLKLEEISQNTLTTHTCVGSIDSYHVASNTWLKTHVGPTATVPHGGFIIGACGIKDELYVVASHALEISFWRWNGDVSARTNGGRWDRMKSPPVTSGRGVAVQFSCAAVGSDKLVALVHVSVVRGRRFIADVARDGALFVYDVATREWSCGPSLSRGARHASCVSVEC